MMTLKKTKKRRLVKINKRTVETLNLIKDELSTDYFVTRLVLSLRTGRSLYTIDEKMIQMIAREEVEKIKVKLHSGKGRADVAFRLL